MRLVWSPSARHDLGDIRRYIARSNPAAAKRTVERILRAVDNLAIFPELGRAGRLQGSRELIIPRTPFIVIYGVQDQAIEIEGVLHTARKWP